ncbi:MAG: hypothetical protein N4A72_14055 [Bacteroidales bacterium]|jgi:hypothetical protein|nr:hypothetical protein [Bacteroidales bacterium]
MKRYFIKYFVLLIVLSSLYGILSGLLTIFSLQLYDILFTEDVSLSRGQEIIYYISTYVIYIINIIAAIFVIFDLKKLGVKSIPVILLTLLAYPIGIILTLILINTKIDR